ncbi:3-hydroxyacyl-ACP dehydratase FabZ [Verrucomicrobiota bacterium]
MSLMEANEILDILPHRYPFMLVDRIEKMDTEELTITGIKNLTFNELFFQGHFPGNPVMPGVLQLEAMAQVAGVLLNKVAHRGGQIAYFSAINNAKFRKVVRPGDVLRMEIKITRMRSRMASVRAEAFVGEELASEADMMFAFGA